MTWSARLNKILDVALRIPSLFVLDTILNRAFLGFLFPDDNLTTSWIVYFLQLYLSVGSFLAALIVFCLSLKHMLVVYGYILSTSIVISSVHADLWLLNSHRLTLTKDNNYDYYYDLMLFCGYLLLQSALANFFIFFRRDGATWKLLIKGRIYASMAETVILISMLFTVILKVTNFSIPYWSPYIPVISFAFVVSDICLSYKPLLLFLKRVYYISRLTLSTVGLQVFIETHWVRLHLPQVLRLFWLCRFAYQLSLYFVTANVTMGSQDYFPSNGSVEDALHFQVLSASNASFESWTEDIRKVLLVRSCETVVSLLGLTSIVSYITHYVGVLVAFCVGSDTDEDRNMGSLSAMLFFILALQTGLTSLNPEKRLIRLYRNFCLLSTAIFHFIHNMVHPLLMSLSASRNMSVTRHLRPLLMCCILIVFPCMLLRYLWITHPVSTWLFAVTAFSIEVVIKVIVTLMVYILFMVDAYRNTFWEKLDDYVYYIQSTGNTIEFLFGIFLFCNGAWIMVFESGGTIRAFMMCIHAYFNIWVQAKEGWKTFMRRRTAVNKINSLPVASKDQLETLNDLCAICFEQLTSARITQCNHFFHGVCLRKWLYIQDKCPLCHSLIYKIDSQQLKDQTNGDVNQNEEE